LADKVVLLLVEDDELVSQFVEDALEDAGYSVLRAKDGHLAVESLSQKSGEIAGLITDIRLGNGPNGWEVACHAREIKSTIAVVYVSGDSAAEWAAHGVPKSIILQKPFVGAQLVTAISSLLNETDSSLN
jgi:DNA-binding response OmpR family regulator